MLSSIVIIIIIVLFIIFATIAITIKMKNKVNKLDKLNEEIKNVISNDANGNELSDKYKSLNKAIKILSIEYQITKIKLGYFSRTTPNDFDEKCNICESLHTTCDDYEIKERKYNELKNYLNNIIDSYEIEGKYENEEIIKTLRNAQSSVKVYTGGYYRW